MKKKIAIWTHGGLGQGSYSQGQPCIHKLIKRLSDHYAIDVFIQSCPDPEFSPEGFGLYTPHRRVRWRLLRWVNLLQVFAARHRKQRYDLFYSFWGYPSGILVVLLARLFGAPSVIHLQGGDAAYVPSLNYGVFCHPLRRKLCVWTYSQCTTLIALTHYQRQFLIRFGVSRPVVVIPYGVDTDVFRYETTANESATVRCLHVGNLTPIKDHETLLHAFAYLLRQVPATLTFVGADYDEGRIHSLCARLQVEQHVSFVGAQPYVELPKYYQTSDILMTTSLFEGQGLVFTEAAACGTLLAGTNVGVLADMSEECGIIVPIQDAEKLANKIVKVLASPAEVDAKKNAARKWVVEKNEDCTVRGIVAELNRLLYRR